MPKGGGGGGGSSTKAGFVFKHSYGQHILKNPLVVDNIIAHAKLKSTDVVLEIGPGTGNLTVKLLSIVKKVIAVELDPRMVAEVQKRVMGTEKREKLQIILGDFLKVDLPPFDVCVANVPYAISSPLVFKLLRQRPAPRDCVLMFQREFAMRLVARPGSQLYCRLSVNTQLLARAKHLMKVSKNSFRPPPKVESSVVSLAPRSPPPPVQFLEWDGLLRLCFSRKNKTLAPIFKAKNVQNMLYENYRTYCALKGLGDARKTEPEFRELVAHVLESSQFASRRSAKLDIPDFLHLLATFNENNIHFSNLTDYNETQQDQPMFDMDSDEDHDGGDQEEEVSE